MPARGRKLNMPRKKSSKSTTPIESFKHRSDTRLNNPTEELRGFEAEEEIPEMLYPRDPSLDPQLVWHSKDEQDREDLSVPIMPIYRQENVQPQAIIEQIRNESQQDSAQEIALFSDFNGMPFEELIEFYQHEQNWTNRMILGDNLHVMASLSEKEGLKSKVQTIYIDPPYGIKFGSNWQVSTRKRDVRDGKVEDVTRQPEQIRAFCDTWDMGIHSYLTYLRDRLTAARELLTESGSIFVQIGDENVHLVRCLLDEVFGSENFVASITFLKTSSSTSEYGGTADYLLWYARLRGELKYRPLFYEKLTGGAGGSGYTRAELSDGTRRPLTKQEIANNDLLPHGARVFAADNLTSQSMGRQKGEGASSWFKVEIGDREYDPSLKARWKTNKGGMARLLAAGRVMATSGKNLAYVRYLDDFPVAPLGNVWTDTLGQNQFGGDKQYVVQTALTVVERCLLMTTDPGDLVLDPTSGIGTTAYVAEQWGRRWITIDTSRVAITLARTRLMSARYPYYLLADSPEGIKREAEITGQIPPSPIPKMEGDIKKGFVYKRVPHVTLKSIANNPDIHEGMSREELAATIARYADSETLFDQPYENKKRLRVTGPFTVESLSPHRTLSEEGDQTHAEAIAQESSNGQFETMILENLKKAGVQNMVREERLKFDRLEPYAGTWIHAEGDYTENGSSKRIAVCIGSQYDTVGSKLVQEAAKEAVK
jgi:adenine-specific DNA-methyltransferase